APCSSTRRAASCIGIAAGAPGIWPIRATSSRPRWRCSSSAAARRGACDESLVPSRRGAAQLMEFWFHLANILHVFSYLVVDILWLRVLAVLGGFSYLTWTLTTPTPSLSIIGWTLVYNTINVVQIARLSYE